MVKKIRQPALQPSENDAAGFFYFNHKCKTPKIHISLIPGSIGTSVEVWCESCGKRKNITDFDTW